MPAMRSALHIWASALRCLCVSWGCPLRQVIFAIGRGRTQDVAKNGCDQLIPNSHQLPALQPHETVPIARGLQRWGCWRGTEINFSSGPCPRLGLS